MKKMLLLISCAAVMQVNAQAVKLNAGKKLTTTNTSSTNMDMGPMMGGEIKISSGSVVVMDITGADNDQLKATGTVTKITLSQEGGGENVNFDSDKKEDMDGEMGKAMGELINKPSPILIDKKTGSIKDAGPEKEKDTDNPFEEIIGGSQSAAGSATGAFYVLPAGKKPGDQWTDSTMKGSLKVVTNYQLQSLKDHVATILIKSKSTGTLNKEVQGTELEITINNTQESTMITDVATGIVKKNTSTTTGEGTLGVMGQSAPFTVTGSSTLTTED